MQKYSQVFGDAAEDFFAALTRERFRHIRLAVSRKGDYLSELKEIGIKYEPVDTAPNVFRITEGDEKLTQSIGFQTGGFYIMNPSSVFTADVFCSLMPEYPYVLDVSSAPGGKTCAIADRLHNHCAIIANEPSNKRLRSLQYNLEKYGAYSVRTVSMDGRSLHKCFDGFFDGILLDAPCSNENKIGRNKTVNSEWTQELTERMAKLQKEIAFSAVKCLKPGGVLVYSTCTFAIEENEQVVRYLLDECDCEIIDINSDKHIKGISGDREVDDAVIRFLPHLDAYDGFFTAALRKKGEPSAGGSYPIFKMPGFVAKFFDKLPDCSEVYEKGGAFYLCTRMDRSINFSKNGIMLMKRQDEPTSQSLWQLSEMMAQSEVTEIPYGDAIRYMKGFDIDIPSDYHGNSVYYKTLPVGRVKNVQGMLKNKLDRYFLYGKNIEW